MHKLLLKSMGFEVFTYDTNKILNIFLSGFGQYRYRSFTYAL